MGEAVSEGFFSDPLPLFLEWYKQASVSEPDSFSAMSLATVDPAGRPHVRMVLLKEVDSEDGFIFYTNMRSSKAKHLLACNRAALCFYWRSLRRQVRIEGLACPVSDQRADAYFAERPRDSQIGSWASRQSEEMTSWADFKSGIARMERRFEGQPVKRPPFWSGFGVKPERVEFWEEGPGRIHKRRAYLKEGVLPGASDVNSGSPLWRMHLLFP